MTLKKTTERTRHTKRQDKVSATRNNEPDHEEMPFTYESVYSVRYTKQVAAIGLATALVLE